MAYTALTPGPPVHGGTALGAHPDHSKHRLGSALHVVRVFVSAAVDVVILGNENKRF